MISRTVVITGATGLIGRHLTGKLNARGDKIIALSTHGTDAGKILPEIYKAVGWKDYLSLVNEKIYGIVNLAGMNLAAKRWNREVKKQIYDSRIGTTAKLIELISKMEIKPEVLVSASGVDYYGDTGDKNIYEDSPPGNSFPARLCVDWEQEAMKAENYGTRVVTLRTGFVIARDSEALKKMIFPFKFFVGGAPGGGKQYLSWIHIDDMTDIYLLALENTKMKNVYNAASPNPVKMKEFCEILGKLLHRPSFMPVPAFAIKLLFGEVSELILSGRKALPKKLLESGYKFRFTDVKKTLSEGFLKE
jgi:uncharacterized protein (TIGR01777 family)